MIKRQSVTACNGRWKKRRSSAVRTLVAETLVLAKTHGYVEKIEDELERELQKDVCDPPQQKILRWRRRGEKIFKSKHVLLTVVILCTVDCALVLAELALDLYKVKASLEATEKLTEATEFFISNMESLHIALVNRTTFDIFNMILDAVILWRIGQNATTNFTTYVPCSELNSSMLPIHVHHSVNNAGNSSTYIPQAKTYHGHDHDLEIVGKIAHVFHYCSIAILALIMIETLLKAVCAGKEFFHRKIEVFDAFVVVMSFLMDFSFLLFLPDIATKDFLFILAFLLPWRVIRVVNSLVVSVKDHEHFRLKLVYKRKKKIQGNLKDTEAMLQKYMSQATTLQRLCIMEGIEEWKIDNFLKGEEDSIPPTPVKKKFKFKFDESIFNMQGHNRAPRCSLPSLDVHGFKLPKCGFGSKISIPSMASSIKHHISKNFPSRRTSSVATDRYNLKTSNGDVRSKRHVMSEDLGTMHEVDSENDESAGSSRTNSESGDVYFRVSISDSNRSINNNIKLRHSYDSAVDERIKLLKIKEEAKRRHSESNLDTNKVSLNSFKLETMGNCEIQGNKQHTPKELPEDRILSIDEQVNNVAERPVDDHHDIVFIDIDDVDNLETSKRHNSFRSEKCNNETIFRDRNINVSNNPINCKIAGTMVGENITYC